MNWVEEAIADLGQVLGLGELALDQERQLTLELESGQLLRMRQLPSGSLLVGCLRPLGYQAPGPALRHALHQASHLQSHPWPLQAVLEEDALGFYLCIPARACSLNELDEALAHLLALQQESSGQAAGGTAGLPFPAR